MIVNVKDIDDFLSVLISSAQSSNINNSIFLVGSYATKSYISGSDVDILIIYNDRSPELFNSNLRSLISSKFPHLENTLDIKVLTQKKISQVKSIEYLMLFSMFQSAKLLHGSQFKLPFKSEQFHEAFLNIQSNLYKDSGEINYTNIYLKMQWSCKNNSVGYPIYTAINQIKLRI